MTRRHSRLLVLLLTLLPAALAGIGHGLGDPTSPTLWIAGAVLALLSAGGWWAARRLPDRTSTQHSVTGDHAVGGGDPDD